VSWAPRHHREVQEQRKLCFSVDFSHLCWKRIRVEILGTCRERRKLSMPSVSGSLLSRNFDEETSHFDSFHSMFVVARWAVNTEQNHRPGRDIHSRRCLSVREAHDRAKGPVLSIFIHPSSQRMHNVTIKAGRTCRSKACLRPNIVSGNPKTDD
jgi:hypothetical protein